MSQSTPRAADSHTGAIMMLLSSPHPRGIGLGANGVAPEIRLKECFLKQDGSKDSDYELAMKSVIEQGWVERISDRVRLTLAGHNASNAQGGAELPPPQSPRP